MIQAIIGSYTIDAVAIFDGMYFDCRSIIIQMKLAEVPKWQITIR